MVNGLSGTKSISNQTKTLKQLKQKLITKNYNEIYICGIGACVNEAIKVALFIIEAIPSVEQSNIITDTISHFDEYINEETNERIGVKEDRRSNIIKIKLIKK